MSRSGQGQPRTRISTWHFAGRHNLDDLMRKAVSDGLVSCWDDCRGDGIWFDAPAGAATRQLIQTIEAAGLKRSSSAGFVGALRRVADGAA